MLETTIAGSLPKPAWLAKPRMLWAPWQLEGEALVEAKRDATLLALKDQEDAGIDIVTDGEQARQHFVHGFLEHIEGIDFTRRVTMGIRNKRYNAEVPTVTGPLRRKQSVHGFEAEIARAHTRRRLKFTLPGPMTIVDTIADAHYGDKVALAMAQDCATEPVVRRCHHRAQQVELLQSPLQSGGERAEAAPGRKVSGGEEAGGHVRTMLSFL
jgi:5-methyltetrahydropteroyltriglutamate--homocysteine methyltransferase